MNAERPRLEQIYKLCRADAWAAAVACGNYTGSADDARDGFIHFSTGAQLAETARRHFSSHTGLVLVAFEAASLGPDLKWERSRGGEMFPHLYAALPAAKALWVKPIELDAGGIPIMPDGVT